MNAEQRGLLFRDAQVRGRRVDVRVGGGVVVELGSGLDVRDEEVVECDGAALLPGLHDHHCHLFAAAAGLTSVEAGPPDVRDAGTLGVRLQAAATQAGWIRAVGYDESVAGDLDAAALDQLRADVPVRVQHRSGALWVVNSAGIRDLGLDSAEVNGAEVNGANGDGTGRDGIERDGSGNPTGRLWRLDGWLRERLGAIAPDIADLSGRLAARGVTGVTDATPDLTEQAVRTLIDQGLSQRLVSLGDAHKVAGVGLGPRKIVVPDHRLPSLDELVAAIRAARPRPVALHCVTREALVLTLTALADAQTTPGDRIEHAAVTPPDAAAWIAALGLTVVTTPSMIARRGDDYLDRVDAEDMPYLWPFRSLVDAGVPVGCSSDAPYGDLDPWSSIAAACERRAPSGRQVGATEAVTAECALRGYLTEPGDPGGRPREVAVGAIADLALLDRSLDRALAAPHEVQVRMSTVGGVPMWRRLG